MILLFLNSKRLPYPVRRQQARLRERVLFAFWYAVGIALMYLTFF